MTSPSARRATFPAQPLGVESKNRVTATAGGGEREREREKERVRGPWSLLQHDTDPQIQGGGGGARVGDFVFCRYVPPAQDL